VRGTESRTTQKKSGKMLAREEGWQKTDPTGFLVKMNGNLLNSEKVGERARKKKEATSMKSQSVVGKRGPEKKKGEGREITNILRGISFT